MYSKYVAPGKDMYNFSNINPTSRIFSELMESMNYITLITELCNNSQNKVVKLCY